MSPKHKLNRILGVTGWSQDKLADLMMVSNSALRCWLKGNDVRQAANTARINWLYEELVAPFLCDIEQKSDDVEKYLLKARIKSLSDDNTCK